MQWRWQPHSGHFETVGPAQAHQPGVTLFFCSVQCIETVLAEAFLELNLVACHRTILCKSEGSLFVLCTNSKQGLLFRKWANKILRQYLLKGFVLDRRRLENPEGRPDFFDELLDKIREIRASEKRMWTRVLELASFCSGYHMASVEDKQAFFATI